MRFIPLVYHLKLGYSDRDFENTRAGFRDIHHDPARTLGRGKLNRAFNIALAAERPALSRELRLEERDARCRCARDRVNHRRSGKFRLRIQRTAIGNLRAGLKRRSIGRPARRQATTARPGRIRRPVGRTRRCRRRGRLRVGVTKKRAAHVVAVQERPRDEQNNRDSPDNVPNLF